METSFRFHPVLWLGLAKRLPLYRCTPNIVLACKCHPNAAAQFIRKMAKEMSPHRISLPLITIGLLLAIGPITACAGPSARDIFSVGSAAPLAEAAGRGDGQKVARLLADGASLATRGDRDVTLLQWMLLNRNLKGFETLLDAGADPAQSGIDGDTAVHLAAAANDPAYLSTLLARGVTPDVPNERTGKTPLASAVMGKRDRQFDMLLQAGSDPGLADFMGNTPLHLAAQINDAPRVLALLDAGAPPKTRNRQGETFQRYLNLGDPKLFNGEARTARSAIDAWLILHNVPIETRISEP